MKYYYIDDEEIRTVTALVSAVNATGKVHMDMFPLKECPSFESVVEKLKNDWSSFDGFLLDLRLNGTGPNHTSFSATTLAQWIRSYAVSEVKPHKPIVLISTDLNASHYELDVTSHDLFDMVIKRSDIEGGWEEFSLRLSKIAVDYKKLNDEYMKGINYLLNNPSLDSSAICFAPFVDESSFNVSQFSSFVLNDLFEHSGLLIDEYVLAARLGVDINKSEESWISLKRELFDKCGYHGIFSSLETRYWGKKVLQMINEVTLGKSFVSMTASQRVEELNRFWGFSLVPYLPGNKEASTYYWTIDAFTKKPLDSCDGYMLAENGALKSWQEPRFVSFDTIEQGKVPLSALLPSEKARYEADLEEAADGEE